MIDTLWGLALAVVAFCAIHLVPVVPGWRAKLIKKLTRNGYRGLFSLFSLLSLGWLIAAYVTAPDCALWADMAWARLLPLAVMPIALSLYIGRYTAPTEIAKLTRHPMVWAVLLWALAHIPANGDAASVLLFGGIALYLIIDLPLNDARRRREEPLAFKEIAATTSILPFQAWLEGRTLKPDWRALGLKAVAPGLVVYLVILFVHRYVFGVSALP